MTEKGLHNDIALSKGGVAPRTAQAAMRHTSIDLTMNVYTDPKLLDVHGALDSLPSLDLDAPTSPERNTMRATGTDDHNASPLPFAPAFAPNIGKSGQAVSFAVISSADADARASQSASDENITMPSEKALFAGGADKASGIGATEHQLNFSWQAWQAGSHTSNAFSLRRNYKATQPLETKVSITPRPAKEGSTCPERRKSRHTHRRPPRLAPSSAPSAKGN